MKGILKIARKSLLCSKIKEVLPREHVRLQEQKAGYVHDQNEQTLLPS